MTTGRRKAKGAGSFTYNDNGTVTMRKGVGYKADGNRKTLTVTADNKTQCMRIMKQKEEQWQKEKNRLIVTGGVTVEELCTKHLEYQMSQNELKPKSLDRRESTIKNQIGKYPIGKMQVQALRAVDVDNHIGMLIKEKRLSVSSIVKTLDVINAAYSWAVSRDELDSNPVMQVAPSIKKKLNKLKEKSFAEADVVVLSDEEVEQFKEECNRTFSNGNPYYLGGEVALFLLYTGMRCGECLSLRWKSYDPERGLITIEKSFSVVKNRDENKKESDSNYISIEGTTKNQKARTIELLPEAVRILEGIKVKSKSTEPESLIFPTRTGKNNTATNLAHRVNTIYKNAGFSDDISGLHILRRTFATIRYEEGWRVKDIAAYIGDLESTTMKYYIAIRKKIKRGNEVMRYVPIPKFREMS